MGTPSQKKPATSGVPDDVMAELRAKAAANGKQPTVEQSSSGVPDDVMEELKAKAGSEPVVEDEPRDFMDVMSGHLSGIGDAIMNPGQMGETISHGLARGATFGFSPKIVGAIGALGDPGMPRQAQQGMNQPLMTSGDIRQASIDTNVALEDKLREDNPLLYGGAELVGGFLPFSGGPAAGAARSVGKSILGAVRGGGGVATEGAAIKNAAQAAQAAHDAGMLAKSAKIQSTLAAPTTSHLVKLAKSTASGAATGAAVGAASGVGYGENQSLGSTAEEARGGAQLGAIVGGVLGPTVMELAEGGRALGRYIHRGLTKEVAAGPQADRVYKAFEEAGGDYSPGVRHGLVPSPRMVADEVAARALPGAQLGSDVAKENLTASLLPKVKDYRTDILRAEEAATRQIAESYGGTKVNIKPVFDVLNARLAQLAVDVPKGAMAAGVERQGAIQGVNKGAPPGFGLAEAAPETFMPGSDAAALAKTARGLMRVVEPPVVRGSGAERASVKVNPVVDDLLKGAPPLPGTVPGGRRGALPPPLPATTPGSRLADYSIPELLEQKRIFDAAARNAAGVLKNDALAGDFRRIADKIREVASEGRPELAARLKQSHERLTGMEELFKSLNLPDGDVDVVRGAASIRNALANPDNPELLKQIERHLPEHKADLVHIYGSMAREALTGAAAETARSGLGTVAATTTGSVLAQGAAARGAFNKTARQRAAGMKNIGPHVYNIGKVGAGVPIARPLFETE